MACNCGLSWPWLTLLDPNVCVCSTLSVCLGFPWDWYVRWCDTLWSRGPESSLCCVQACLSQLSAAALIVVRRHSSSAGHPQQSYQEKTQFKSLPIIKIEVSSCSLLLEAFSSLSFLAHLPPTHPKTRVRWKGSLSSTTYMPLTVEWNIYLGNLKTCIRPWH